MIALYIILGVLLFLFLLTLLNIWVYAVFDEELKLSVRVAFVKLRLLPEKPKKPKKKPKKKPSKKKKPKQEEPEKKKSFDIKGLVKEKGVSGILKIIRGIAELALGTLKDLFSKITVKQFRLKLRVAGSDAADSAVKYGRVCAVLYPSLKVISEIVTLKNYDIDVEPDFSDEPKNTAQAEVVAKIRVLSVVIIAFRRGIQALKLLLKARPKHRKKADSAK